MASAEDGHPPLPVSSFELTKRYQRDCLWVGLVAALVLFHAWMQQSHVGSFQRSGMVCQKEASNSHGNSRNSQPQGQPHPDFFIVIGLEGTGHHLFESIYQQSPSWHYLKEWNISSVTSLRYSMFHNQNFSHSLFGARCGGNTTNMTQVFQTTVDRLVETAQSIQDRAKRARVKVPVSLGLNAAPDFAHDQVGMLSYPNFRDDLECPRAQKFPDLHLLYDACDAANVNCGHIYQYRNPYSVVYSTVIKRDYSKTPLQAMGLYRSMLDHLRAQMMDHPDKLIACWPYDAMADDNWWHIGKLLGWSNRTAFRQVVNETEDVQTLNATEHLRAVPPQLSLYMDKLMQAHNRAWQLCEEQMRGRSVVR